MIKELQPLGEKNTIHILLAYGTDNTVTATISVIPKDDKSVDRAHQTLQLSGPIDEVVAAIPRELTAGVSCVARFQSNLADVEAQTEKAIKEAQAKAPKGKKEHKTPPPPADTEKKEEAPPAAPVTAELDLTSIIAQAQGAEKK